MARVFFALWPDAAAREALAVHAARLAREARGRVVPAANFHLTLAFLGEVDAAGLDRARCAAGRVDCPAFALGLDCQGSFRRAGVAWVGCREAPPPLLALQSALERSLGQEGFAPEPRPYAPHLTLARRIAVPVEAGTLQAVRWEARSFALVESRRDRGGYANVAEWALRGG